jgi:hypothetical protein
MASKRSRKRRKNRARASAGAPPSQAAGDGTALEVEETGDRKLAKAARRRSAPGGPPPPPWGSFPLSELVVLVGLVMLVAGFLTDPPRGAILLVTGLVLGAMAGLEIAVREHFSGYRSHTVLLSAAIGMAVLVGLVIGLEVPPIAGFAAGLAAFAAAAYFFATAFRRRSGGALFKISRS